MFKYTRGETASKVCTLDIMWLKEIYSQSATLHPHVKQKLTKSHKGNKI